MGAAKKLANRAEGKVVDIAEQAGLDSGSGFNWAAYIKKRREGVALPFMQDSTDSMLKELARMGIQRKLLQSSGRLGAFKGFDANFRPVGR